ncbi:MAG: hypothetical protein ABSH46_17865 [Bryobacteraceae bacterium]
MPNVFNIFRAADEPGDGTQNALPVCLHNLVEGAIVTLAGTFYHLGIDQHAVPIAASGRPFLSQQKGEPANYQVTPMLD